SSYGTATFSGSDEEADYIGLPGLLGADDVKALLRQREKEQMSRASRPAPGESAPGGVAAVASDPSMSRATLPGNAAGPGSQAGAAAERVASAAEPKDLRRPLNTAVSVFSGPLGKEAHAMQPAAPH